MPDDDQGSPDCRTQDTGSAPTQMPGPRPRPSRAGTRNVATLSSEQLSKKRANDREAQRAIRQRTREYVERLEFRIKELSADERPKHPTGPTLEEVQRRNVELEQELQRLRTILFGYGSDDRPSPPGAAPQNVGQASSPGFSGNPSGPDPHISQSPNERLSPLSERLSPTSSADSPQSPEMANPSLSTSVQLVPGAVHPPTQSFNDGFRIPSGPDLPDHMIPSSLDPPDSYHTHIAFAQTKREDTPTPKDPADVWPAPSVVINIGVPNPGSVISGIEPLLQEPFSPEIEVPLYFSQPLHPEKNIMFAVVKLQRDPSLAREHVPASRNPNESSLSTIIDPERANSANQKDRTVSAVLDELKYRTHLEKISTLVIMYPIFSWQYEKTYEAYCNLPPWSIPHPAQLNIPHPPWITYLRWPELRATVITNQEKYATDEFQYIYIISSNLGWPYESSMALTWQENSVKVTDTFTRFATAMDNMSLDKPFQIRFPELRGVCRFTHYLE